ncbi:MAG TPA: hypothetical protein PKM03_03825 [Cyclobacteriaceae bacterium]|nr:hypothetical protein [Cyclobacteriaceae bacterium]
MLIIVGFILESCLSNQDLEINSTTFFNQSDSQAKTHFAKGLAQAISQEKHIREFIKYEALKTFDGDYDVPYSLVKDKLLPNGKTFQQSLAPYFKEVSLKDIEQSLPLLTIFVPTLPEKTFSAELWDTENQVPYIAIRLNDSNDVPIISPEGEEYLLESSLVPSYPVLVVKNCERLVYSSQQGYQFSNGSRVILTTPAGISYKFADDIFDFELQKQKELDALREGTVSTTDSKLVDAYSQYLTADGWQRDFIYYDITPTSPNGQFTFDFSEHIRSFSIVGDALLAYQKMADQSGDPKIKSGKKSSGWTDGYFEIRASVLIQAQNGIGSTIPNSYLVSGRDLFSVTYEVDRRGVWPFRYDYYIVKSVTAKPQSTNMPIVPWDLKNYGASFRVDIEETDVTTIVTESTSETTKFATNFSIEGQVLKKIGLKFGASLERTETNTITRQYTLNSDPLGSVVVNFSDKVIVSASYPVLEAPQTWRYNTREYANDIFSISVEPKRVQ